MNSYVEKINKIYFLEIIRTPERCPRNAITSQNRTTGTFLTNASV